MRRLGGAGFSFQQLQFLMFLQYGHVEIARGFDPILLGFGGERPRQPQAAGLVWEEPHDAGAALEFFVEPFEHVYGLQGLVVFPRQPVEGTGVLDVVLDPVAELGVLALPILDPGRQVPPGFLQVPAAVEPAQFRQVVVVSLARQVVERVAQEVDVAPLPRCLREEFLNRPPQAGMGVAAATPPGTCASSTPSPGSPVPRPALPAGYPS